MDFKDNSGYTSLMEAAWKGHTDVVYLLLEAGQCAYMNIR